MEGIQKCIPKCQRGKTIAEDSRKSSLRPPHFVRLCRPGTHVDFAEIRRGGPLQVVKNYFI